MGLVKVFAKNVQIEYKSKRFSKVTTIVYLTTLSMFLFALVIGYRSRGFWIKTDVFYEKPDVKFTNEFIFVAVTNGNSTPVVCQKSSHYNHDQLMDKCSSFEIREIDENGDQRFDKVVFNLDLQESSATVTEWTLILQFGYKLNTICDFEMRTLVVVQETFSSPVNDYKIVGDVKLQQKIPLACVHNIKDVSLNDNFINKIFADNIFDQLTENHQRSARTILINQMKQTTNDYEKQSTSFEIILHFPRDTVQYFPSFWQMLKWAWIQYFSILIILLFILNKLKGYVFANNLVKSFKIVPYMNENVYYY